MASPQEHTHKTKINTMNDNAPQEQELEIAPESAEATAEDFCEVVETDAAADAPTDQDEQSIIEKLKSALEESEKRALIAVADLENYRKRASKNAQEQLKYASLPLMGELLETVDNLNRAIESANEESADSAFLEGVKMVSAQILNVLQSNKCELIPSVGETFDPNLHQAIQMQPSEEFPTNTVMMEMRTGYRLHDRVIRPSQVFVSTGNPAKDEN